VGEAIETNEVGPQGGGSKRSEVKKVLFEGRKRTKDIESTKKKRVPKGDTGEQQLSAAT